MATGYTYPVRDGKTVTFEQFALDCARAFGALVELRDDTTAPIPDKFEPSDYHVKEIAQANIDLAEAMSWTPVESSRRAEAAYKDACAAYAMELQADCALRARYTEMLSKVERWIPPSELHENLKKFMREQLTTSIEHDCFIRNAPVRLTGAEFKNAAIRDANRSIDYSEKAQREEVARAEERTAWITLLKKSLKEPA